MNPLLLRTLVPLLTMLTVGAARAQPPPQLAPAVAAEAPPEIGIREYVKAPSGGLALWEQRTDARPARHWPAGRRLYVQTAPDTTWFRVLLLGNSYFVRQRELPVPGWR